MEEEYLGDGLYVSFDGYMFRLRAPRIDGDHIVFLEPSTLNSFNEYVRKTHERYGSKT